MAEVQKDTVGSRENTLRFLDLVGMFSSQAMIGLGKIANPMTGKAEKNLPAARLFIDTLEMLEQKTTGNLTAEEKKVLQAALTDLRIMFVEESTQKDEGQKTKDETPTVETDEPKVKFQKKYD